MSAEQCPSWDGPHVTPAERLRRRVAVAIQAALAEATGTFTSHRDGWLSAPDVPGIRFKLVTEIDPAKASQQLALFAAAEDTDPEEDA